MRQKRFLREADLFDGLSLQPHPRTMLCDHIIFNSPAMSTPTEETPSFIHSDTFLHGLMKRQLKLSITCAAAFLIVLFGLPLLNYFAPVWMARRVWGFPMSWLILGVLFFPYVWVIAAWFIRKSMALEQTEVQWVKSIESAKESQPTDLH
jgi:uncharacterized membrane protein (DUF485 family)